MAASIWNGSAELCALRVPTGSPAPKPWRPALRSSAFASAPAARRPGWGCPASEIVDSRVPLDEFWGAEAHHLAEAANTAPDVAARVRVLESALSRRASSITLHPRDMRAAYALIAAGEPPSKSLIPWLARELALSERTLRRRFDEAFGYGPKTLDRILRFQRFLALARGTRNPSAASLAAAAGYADQAHLTRECRRLAVATPGEILGRLTNSAAA